MLSRGQSILNLLRIRFDLFRQLLTPDLRMENVGSGVQGEVAAGLFVGAYIPRRPRAFLPRRAGPAIRRHRKQPRPLRACLRRRCCRKSWSVREFPERPRARSDRGWRPSPLRVEPKFRVRRGLSAGSVGDSLFVRQIGQNGLAQLAFVQDDLEFPRDKPERLRHAGSSRRHTREDRHEARGSFAGAPGFVERVAE